MLDEELETLRTAIQNASKSNTLREEILKDAKGPLVLAVLQGDVDDAETHIRLTALRVGEAGPFCSEQPVHGPLELLKVMQERMRKLHKMDEMVIVGECDKETADTAVRLWETSIDGPLGELENALKAARKL